MAKTFVLTFVAEDRPGLVEMLSNVVVSHGGDWLESRMAHLAGKFAGIARVQIPDDRSGPFTSAIAALEAEGFRLTIEGPGAATSPAGPTLMLDLVGPDQPGIVRDISRCLAERGVSVEEMETDIREAPMGGGLLFYARARMRAPTDLDEAELRQAIESLSAALMVDITFREDEPEPGAQ